MDAKNIQVAWDVVGTGLRDGYGVRMVNGRTVYEEAYVTKTDNVCLLRLHVDSSGIREIRRYVRHNAAVELVKISGSHK